MSPHARRGHAAASSCGAGKSPHRVGQVGVGVGVAGRRPSTGTARSNHSSKNVDSGGRCGVVISRTTTRPPGAHDARHLAQALLEVGEVAHAEADRRRVELAVANGSASALAGAHDHSRPRPQRPRSRLRARELQHLLGEVGAHDLAAGADPLGELERQVTGPGGDVEHPAAGSQTAPARRRAAATGGAAQRSSPSSAGHTRPRCGRTSPAPGLPRGCLARHPARKVRSRSRDPRARRPTAARRGSRPGSGTSAGLAGPVT